MLAKHTPGPWSATGLYIEGPQEQDIATAHGDDEEALANARIMSLSPKLYGMLQEVAPYLLYAVSEDHPILAKVNAMLTEVDGEPR